MHTVAKNWTCWFLAGAFVGAALAATAAFVVERQTAGPGRVVDLGPVESLATADLVPPLLDARDGFYLVKMETGDFHALYVYPTTAARERRDCAIVWDGTFRLENRTGFLGDRCSGAGYHLDGSPAFGPIFRPLDQFPVQITNGRLLVDTRRLQCNGPRPCTRTK